MRAIAALTVFVSVCLPFATPVFAGEWGELREKGINELKENRYPEAVEALQAALQASGDDDQKRAVTSYELGAAMQAALMMSEARKPLSDALELWRTRVPDAGKAARAAETLSVVERRLGNYSTAEKILRDALKWAPKGGAQALVQCALGDLLREQGFTAEALVLFDKASQVADTPWQRRYDVLTGVADLYRDGQDWDASAAKWTEAAELARANSRPSLEAIALRGLGNTWLQKGDLTRAEPLLKRALATLETDPGASLQVSAALTCLGELYIGQDRLGLAEDALRRAAELEKQALTDTHPQLAVVFRLLADAESRRGDFESARRHLEQGRMVMAAGFGENSPMVGAMLASAGVVEQRAHNNEAAVERYQQALAMLDQPGPRLEKVRATVMANYAAALKATHRKSEANAVLARAKLMETQVR